MQERLRNFFYKNIVIKYSTIEVCVLIIINMFFKYRLSLYAHMIVDIALTCCIIALYVAFTRHNKNMQKGMLGAVLMWYFYDELLYVVDGIILNEEIAKTYSSTMGRIYIILTIVMLVIYVVFFINYFVISGDHHSRPSSIMVNHILVIILAILSIVTMLAQIQVIESTEQILEVVTWQIAFSIFILMIAAYETHFDEYRINRETAGWTENAGYPKGYIHEYQKINKDKNNNME